MTSKIIQGAKEALAFAEGKSNVRITIPVQQPDGSYKMSQEFLNKNQLLDRVASLRRNGSDVTEE
jgi:hypothetical protein